MAVREDSEGLEVLAEEAEDRADSVAVAEASMVALEGAVGEDSDAADSISTGHTDRLITGLEARPSTLRPIRLQGCPPRSPDTFKTVSGARLEAR